MKILGKLLVVALTLIGISYLSVGISVESFYIAVVVAVILGLLNILVRPVLLFLTLPINILTLGLFTFVINALLFWFVASFVDGFVVSGFLAAFLGALVVSVANYIAEAIFEND
jgi:putative membrane protein